MYRLVTHYEEQRYGKNVLKPDINWEDELRGNFYRKYVKSFNGCSVWIPETEYKVHDVPTNFTRTTPLGYRKYYETNSSRLLSYPSFRAKMIAGTSITEAQFDYWDHLTNFWEQHSYHLHDEAYETSHEWTNGYGTYTDFYKSYKIQREIDLLMIETDVQEENINTTAWTAFYYKNYINTFQNQFPAVNHNMSIHLLALKIKDRIKPSHADKPEIYLKKSDGTQLRIEMTETRYPPSSYFSLASEIRFDFVKKVAGNINTFQTEKSNANLIAESYTKFNKKRPTNFSWIIEPHNNLKDWGWGLGDPSEKNRPSAVYNEDLTARNHWIIDMTYWKTKYQLFFRKAFVLSDDPNFHQGKIIEYPWNPTGRYKTNNLGIPGTTNINFGDYPLIDYIVDTTHQVSENFNEWEYLLNTVFGNLADFRSEMLFKLKDLGSIMLRYFPEGTVRTQEGRPDNYDEQRDGPLIMGLSSFDWGVDGSKGFLWDPTCYGLTKNEDIKWFHLNGGIYSTAPFVLISRIDFGGKFPTMFDNDHYCFFKIRSTSLSFNWENNWDVIYDKTKTGFRYYMYFINMKWLSEASGRRITKLNHTRWKLWDLDSSLRNYGILRWKYPHAFNIPVASRNRSKENGQWSPLILKTFDLLALSNDHPLKRLCLESEVNTTANNYFRKALRHDATPSGGVVFSLTEYANNPDYNYTLTDSDENYGYTSKRAGIEYLSEYMRQNDYHSCTFLYYEKKPYLHFIARDYVVRETWETGPNVYRGPNVDQGWDYQTSTLYIKDVDFRPDVYNFEDNPNERSFEFQYDDSKNRFQFLWVAKKTINGYSEPIRVLKFELYYFKDKNVGSMSEGYDASFMYTLEDLHSDFSGNPRVQAADHYVLEEPYYYYWEDNLNQQSDSDNKIVHITGTWFIKAINKSGPGNPSLPVYINPNIAVSQYEWHLYDNSTLSLIWNHPQHLIDLKGPIKYVLEYTSLAYTTEVALRDISNPTRPSSYVGGISGSLKELYLIPGEGILRIQTYAYGIQPDTRNIYRWNLLNPTGMIWYEGYDYGNYVYLVESDGNDEDYNVKVGTNKFPFDSYALNDVKERATKYTTNHNTIYIVQNEEPDDSSYYLYTYIYPYDLSRVMYIENPVINSIVRPDSYNDYGLRGDKGDLGTTWIFQVKQFTNRQNTNIITTGDNIYANVLTNFKKDRSLKLFLEGHVGFNLWGWENDIDVMNFRFTDTNTWWWFAVTFEPTEYPTYKFKFYATKNDEFNENDKKWEENRVIERFDDTSVRFGIAEEVKHTSNFDGEIRYFHYHRKALNLNEINNLLNYSLNNNKYDYTNPEGTKKYVYKGTIAKSLDEYFIDDITKDSSNTILTLEISPSSVLGAQKLNDFKNNPLIFRYDYSVRKYYFEFSDPNPQNFVIVNLQILDNFEWIGLGLDSVTSITGKKRIYIPNFFNRVRQFQDGYWRVIVKLFNDSEVDDTTPKTQPYKNGFVDSFELDNDNNKPRNLNSTFALNSSNEPIITLEFKIPYLPDENIYIPGPIEFRIYKQTGTTYTLFETFTVNNTALNEDVSYTINVIDISPDDIIGTYYVGTFWSLNESETLYYNSITNFNQNPTNILNKLFVSFDIAKPEIPTNFDIVFPTEAHGNIILTWDLPSTVINNKSDYFYDVYIRTRNDSLIVQYIAKLYSISLDNISNESKYEHTIESEKIFNYSDIFSENSDIITVHVNTGYLCELLIKVIYVCIESDFSDVIFLKQPTIPNNDRPPTQMVREYNGRIMQTNEYLFVYDLNHFNGSFLYLKDLQLTLPTMQGDVEYSLLEENFRYVDPDVEPPTERIERIKYHIIRKIDDISVILSSEDFTSTINYVEGKYPYINLDVALDDLKTKLQEDGVSEAETAEIALEDILFILKLDLAYIVVVEGDVTLYLDAFDSLIDIENLPITFTAEPQPVPKEFEEYEPLEHPLREKTLLDGIDFDITKAGHVFSKEVKTKNIKSSYSYEKNDNDKYIEPVLKIESKSAINLEIKDASEILEIGDKIIFTNGKGLQKALNTIIFEKQIELELKAPYMYIQIPYSDKIRFNIVEMKLPPILGNSIIDLKFDLYEHDDVRQTMFASNILSVNNFKLNYPQDFNSGSFLRQISFDDYEGYNIEKRYTVSLSFEILRLGDYGNNSTIFVNNVRVVALENIPLVDSIDITECQIINTIYSQSIYLKFRSHQRILSGIDTTFSIGFYDINDSVFDINTYIYQDLSLDSITEFFEFHYQLFNVFDKYNINNFINSDYYKDKYTPNSTVKDHQFIQNVQENVDNEVLYIFVKNTLNMNTPVDIAADLKNRIEAPPSPEEHSTKDFITLERDGLYYFNFKVENTECSYDEFIANGKIIPPNKLAIKLTSFLEFHLEKEDVLSTDSWDPDFIIYYDHTRNLPTETEENDKKYLEYSIPFGLDDLHDDLKDLITTFNPTSLLVGNWRLKIVNMYKRYSISSFEFDVSPPQLPTINVITHIGLTKYKIEFVDAIEDSYTIESLHFDSIESDRKSIIIHRFDFSYIVPHERFEDVDGHEVDYGPEYPFLLNNALMVYSEIRQDNGNHFDLENVDIVGFPRYSKIEQNSEPNNIYYYFKLIYLDEIEQNEFSQPVLTPLNWISKEDDIDLVIEHNTEDSVRDTISIDDGNGGTLTINTFYYKHTIYFTLNEVSRTMYIDSEEYNLKITNKNGKFGDGIDFYVKDILGVDFKIELQRNFLRRSYDSGIAKDRTFKCPYEVKILKGNNFLTTNNIVYDLDCNYWIHAVVDDYEFKENKTLEHFYINVADELYSKKAPTLYTYPSSVIEYKVINDILVLQEMTGSKRTYFDFKLSYTYQNFNFIYRTKIPWLSAQDYWNINFDNYTNPHLFAQENKFFSPSGDPLNARNYAQHGMYQYVEGFTPISRPKLRLWNGKVSTVNFDWSPSSEKPGLNYFSYTYNRNRNTGDYDKTWTISEHFLPIIYKQNREKESLITRRNVHEKINFKPIHSFNTDKPYKIKDIHPTSYVPAFIDKIYFENKNSRFYTQDLPIAQEYPEYHGYIRLGDTISDSPMLVNGVFSYEYEVNNIRTGWWGIRGLNDEKAKPDGNEPTVDEKRRATWTPSFYRVNHNTLKELLYNNQYFFEKIKYIIEIRPERCTGYNMQLHLWKKTHGHFNQEKEEYEGLPDLALKSNSAIGLHEDNINAEKYTFFRLEKFSRDPDRRTPFAHEKFYVPVKENTMHTRFSIYRHNPNPTPIFSCEYLLYTTNDKLTTLLNNQPGVKYLYNGVDNKHPYNDTLSANVGYAPPNGEVLQERTFDYDTSFEPLDYLEKYDTPYSKLLFMPYSQDSLPGYHEIYTDYHKFEYIRRSHVAEHVVYTEFQNPINSTPNTFRSIIYEVEYPSTESINPVNYFDPDQNLEQYVWYNRMIGMQSPFTPEMLWEEPNDNNIGMNNDEINIYQYQFDNVIFEATREFYYYYDGQWDANLLDVVRDLGLYGKFYNYGRVYSNYGRVSPNNPYNQIKWYHLNTTLTHTPSNLSYTYNSNYPYDHTTPTYGTEGGPTRNADDSYLYYPWYVDDNESGNGTSGYEFNRDEIVIHLERKVFNGFHLDLYLDHEIWNYDRKLENLRTSMLACGMQDGGKYLFTYLPKPVLQSGNFLDIYKNNFPEFVPSEEKVLSAYINEEPRLNWFLTLYSTSLNAYDIYHLTGLSSWKKYEFLEDYWGETGKLWENFFDNPWSQTNFIPFINLLINPKIFAFSELHRKGFSPIYTRNFHQYSYTQNGMYPITEQYFKNDPESYYYWARFVDDKYTDHVTYYLGHLYFFLEPDGKPVAEPGRYHSIAFQDEGWRENLTYNVNAKLYGKYKDKFYFSPLDIYSTIHLNFRYLISLRCDCEFIPYNKALMFTRTMYDLDNKRNRINAENLIKWKASIAYMSYAKYKIDPVSYGAVVPYTPYAPYYTGAMLSASNLELVKPLMKIYEDYAESNIETRSTYAITEFQFGVYPGDPRHDVSYSNLLMDPFKEYFNANDETLLHPMDYIEEPLQAGPWPSTSNVLKLFYSNWDTKNDDEKDSSVSSDLRFSRWRNLKNSGNFANPFVRHEFLRRINKKGYSTHENQQYFEILTDHLTKT
jgi:hypothetical protein